MFGLFTPKNLPFAIFVIWLAVILIIIRITMEESNISYSEIRWNRIANNASLHGGKILGLITNEKNSSVEVTEKFKEIKKIEKPKEQNLLIINSNDLSNQLNMKSKQNLSNGSGENKGNNNLIIDSNKSDKGLVVNDKQKTESHSSDITIEPTKDKVTSKPQSKTLPTTKVKTNTTEGSKQVVLNDANKASRNTSNKSAPAVVSKE